jgi:hypothetical protein
MGLGVCGRSFDLSRWFFTSKASTLAQWRWICHSGGGCVRGEEYAAIRSSVLALIAVERLPIDIGIK